MANTAKLQGEQHTYTVNEIRASDVFGKAHDKAGKPRKSSSGKDALFVRLRLTRDDGTRFFGSMTAVPIADKD